MNIGVVSKHCGLAVKTIRYYEDIGLVTPLRDTNGYRAFRESDAHKLTFVAQARVLGFSIADCRELLALWEDTDRASASVRMIAKQHLQKIEAKMADLQNMHTILSDLIRDCAGDTRPDCPILNRLGQKT